MNDAPPPPRSTMPDPDSGTHGSPERPARSLDLPLAWFDLAAETASLREERAYREGDRTARTLVKEAWFRSTLVALRPGAVFDEAEQRGVICLQVIEGRLTLEVGGRTMALGAGEIAVIGVGQPWRARTLAETSMLVQLSWPPEPGDTGGAGGR